MEGHEVVVDTETFPDFQHDISNEDAASGIGPQHFNMISLLGRGATAKVFLVRCTLNNKVYAMKILEKRKMKTKHAVEDALYERKVLSRVWLLIGI